MLEVAMQELKKAATDFYNVTHIMIVLYDENRNFLYSYPEKHCEFCRIISSHPELSKKCYECDNIGFDICDKTKKPYIYRCHMNLYEAIAPIIENDVIIGYMMIGQILNEENRSETLKKTEEVAKKYDLDFSALTSSLSGLPAVSCEFIYSSISMASMCACYLYCNKIIKDRSDILAHQLTHYIENHLGEDLSIKTICREFGFSRSKLYKISAMAFGSGISDYITKRRVEEAKKQLAETSRPIYEISEAVGYKDANYFVRNFKSITGVTPGKYRKEK